MMASPVWKSTSAFSFGLPDRGIGAAGDGADSGRLDTASEELVHLLLHPPKLLKQALEVGQTAEHFRFLLSVAAPTGHGKYRVEGEKFNPSVQ